MLRNLEVECLMDQRRNTVIQIHDVKVFKASDRVNLHIIWFPQAARLMGT